MFSFPQNVLLLFAACCGLACSSALNYLYLSPIPSIEKVAVGVNMFRMQPDGTNDTASDPGLCSLPIFNTSSYSQGKTWDEVFAIPNALLFRPAPSCSYTSQVSTVSSSLGFLQSLYFWARSSSHFLFWKHTTDHEFNEVASQTAAMQTVSTKAKAVCTAYTAGVDFDALTPSSLTTAFTTDVITLLPTTMPATYENFYTFVDRWGTHFLNSALLGASSSIITTFTKQSWTKLESESTNFNAGASLSFLAAFGDPPLASDKNFADYQALQAAASSETLLYAGPKPPSGPGISRNATAWAEAVQLPNGSPVIIGYSATNLSALIARADLYPNEKPEDMAARASVFQAFIDNIYCEASNDVKCAPFQRNSDWDESVSLATPLANAAAASDGQVVYVIGGQVTTSVSTAVSSGSLRWHTSQPSVWGTASPFDLISPPFYQANAQVQNGLTAAAAAVDPAAEIVYVSGGVNAAGVVQSGIAQYNAQLQWWNLVGTLQTPRSGHCGVILNGMMYLFGGYDSHGSTLSSLEIFSLDHRSTTFGQSIPTALARHACVVVNGQVWLIGGISTPANAPLSSIYVYDPPTDSWTQLSNSPLPAARASHVAAVINDAVFVIGGVGASGAPLLDVHVFNVSAGVYKGWVQGPPLVSGRISSAVAVYYEPHSDANLITQGPNNGGFVITVLGGYDGNSKAPLQTVGRMKVFDTQGNFEYNPMTEEEAAQYFQERAQLRASHAEKKQQHLRRQTKRSKASKQEKIPMPVPSSVTGSLLPVFPGIDLLSHTYNPITATPNSQVDVGWQSGGAFHVACPTCFSENKTLNDVYRIPNGVSVNIASSTECSFTSSSVVIRTSAELQANLGLFARLNADLFGLGSLLDAAFSVGALVSVSGSADLSASETIVTSTATCVTFEAELDAYDFEPVFYQGFVNAVKLLPPNWWSNTTAYVTFVSQYGIAYVQRLLGGSKIEEVNSLSTLSFAQSLSIQANVAMQSSYSFFFLWGGSSSAGGKFAFKEWLQFAETVDSNYTQCAPSCPSPNPQAFMNASQWAAAAKKQPVAITYDLAPIWDLIGIVTVNGKQSVAAQRRSLQAQAAKRGDFEAVEKFASIAQTLAEFINSGAYCGATPGCTSMTGGPYWNIPEVQAAQTLPYPVSGSTAATISWAASSSSNKTSDVIIVAGGVNAEGAPPISAALLFDTSNPYAGWQTLPAMPQPQAYAASTVLDNAVWIAGGINSQYHAVATVSMLTQTPLGAVWQVMQSLPAPLCYHAMVTVAKDTILTFGGCMDGTACKSPSASIFVFSSTTGWTTLPKTMPSGPTWGHSAVASADGTLVFVAGGQTPTRMLPFLFVFDVTTGDWNNFISSAAPAPFAFASAVLLPTNQILFSGGLVYNPSSQTVQPSMVAWTYNAQNSTWNTWSSALWPTFAASTVVLADGIPGAANIVDPVSSLNATLPVVWVIGGTNSSSPQAPSLAKVAQFRNLPSA